jgi:putative oxidoreductase
MDKNKVISLFLILLKMSLGFVFVVASLGKIIDPAAFAADVYSYAILPSFIVPAFAALVPWIEFVAGALLMLDIAPKSNALIINLLLLSFIGAIALDLARGVEISCGCFDFLFPQEEIGLSTIVRDLIMLAAGVAIMFLDHNEIRMYVSKNMAAPGRVKK